MYKLTFKLKQHTPIIHFQHDQHGATLRATELKPKLDKFILTKLGKETLDEKKQDEKPFTEKEYLDKGKEIAKSKVWIIDGQDGAMNYKVKITSGKKQNLKMHIPDEPKKGKWSSSYPTFFANMGKDTKEELVNFSMFDNVVITITCFIRDLKDKIEDDFAEFIAVTNFGTRQSKGFGSFYLDAKDKNYKKINRDWFNYKTSVSINKNDNEQITELFGKIELFYRALRTGINEKRPIKENNKIQNDENNIIKMRNVFYMKPLIFLYFNNKQIQWEKKTIKENYFNNDLLNRNKGNYYGLKTQKNEFVNSDVLTYSSEKKKIIKDLLGLSTEESWRSYNNAVITKTETKLDNSGKPIFKNEEVVDKEESKRIIDRFQSPITFVPIENNNGYDIYLIFNEQIEIKGTWFNINNTKYYGNTPFPLQVADDFSLKDFFLFFTSKDFKIEEYYNIYDKKIANEIIEILNEMFNNLQKQTVK
ncbi:MAG: hypothetical protein K8R54_09210 [Bacteroidales bacterium]|nr:hypothetical protein [Bacteroidales bacterium]